MQFLKINICIFILHAAVGAAAQDEAQILLLKKELASASGDSAKAVAFAKLGYEYRNTNPDSGIYYTNSSLALSQKIKDQALIAKAKYQLGRLYHTKSNDSAAIILYNESLKLFELLKDTANMATLHMQMGYVYSRSFRNADMLKEFLLSLKLAERSNNKEKMSDALYSISDYYRHIKDDSTAVIYLKQALEIDTQLGNKKNIASDYQYLGLCYGRLRKYREGEEYLNKALVIFKSLKDDFRLATSYSYLADLYNEKQDFDKSIEAYLKAKNIMDAIGAKIESADITDNIASEFLRKKEYANAIKYATMGLAVANEIKAQPQLYYLYNTLAKASEGLMDYESAYEYMQKAAVLHDTLIALEQNDKLAQMQTQFETERKEKENQLLKAQNETANANLQRNRIFLIAAVSGLLLLAILLYVIYKNKEAKAKYISVLQNLNKQLNDKKEEISGINTVLQLKALRAQMNPHFIFNCMSSIQECILTGRVDDANKYLSKLSRLLRMVLMYADEESIALDKELEMLELYLELESVRLKQNFQYTIEIDETIFPDEVQVPTLLLQPFVENAIWHGLLHKQDDRLLTVKISCTNNYLHCIIEDNGIGRQKAAELLQFKKRHQSKGLKITANRLVILKERTGHPETGFEIIDLFNASQEATGTRVYIKLPFDN
ncbi:MAG TPA: histidine kinase [Panacibacter sp.]|nr:histidine kinase [Panacibacter sp.]